MWGPKQEKVRKPWVSLQSLQSSGAVWKSRCPFCQVPIKPHGFCGRKVTLNLQCLRTQALCEHGSLSSGLVWTGRWACALTPYPILPPSLINNMVSGDIKHHERRRKGTRRRRTTELRSCVNREVGLGLIPYLLLSLSLISHTLSVDVEDHERRRWAGRWNWALVPGWIVMLLSCSHQILLTLSLWLCSLQRSKH